MEKRLAYHKTAYYVNLPKNLSCLLLPASLLNTFPCLIQKLPFPLHYLKNHLYVSNIRKNIPMENLEGMPDGITGGITQRIQGDISEGNQKESWEET